MYKQHLLKNIEKEIKICCRLYTKIPPDKMDFRPKEGVRSILELLQYLSFIGAALPIYWLKKEGIDFRTFFDAEVLNAKAKPHEEFLTDMHKQIETIHNLFNNINEGDLLYKEVAYPWGGKAPLGEAIIETSIKYLTAYKLQLFLFIKLATNQNLTTLDAWILTELA